MAILKTVLWSLACVGFGFWLGITRSAPGPQPSPLSAVRGELEGAVATAKLKLASKGDQPKEVHTASERDAVNALVARRSSGTKR